MKVVSLHHLRAPCKTEIRKMDETPFGQAEVFYLNPKVIIRKGVTGGTIFTPEMAFLYADSESLELLAGKVIKAKDLPNGAITILCDTKVILPQKPEDFQPTIFHVEHDALPTQVLLDVTAACNCDCFTCYHKTDLDSYVPSLAEVLQRIEKLKDLGVYQFEITGGEPFIRGDLNIILQKLLDLKLHFYVVTNGEFLAETNPEIISLLRHSLGLCISLDGYGQVHDQNRQRPGLFAKILKGLERIRKDNIRILFISTMNELNVDCFPQMVRLAEEYGTTVHLRPTIMAGGAQLNGVKNVNLAQRFPHYLQDPHVRNGLLATRTKIAEARYYGCGIRKRISVDARGALFPCVMDRSRAWGDIMAYDQQSILQELDRETTDFLNLNKMCRNCSYNKEEILCGGFCRFSQVFRKGG